MFSATCPYCGSLATGTLASDPSVPLYACGYAGKGHELAEARRAGALRPFETRNVVPLELEDAMTLGIVAAQVERAL